MSREEARRMVAAIMNDPIPWYKQSSSVPSRSMDTNEDIRNSLFALGQLKENLPDAKYSPVTWEEAQAIFSTPAAIAAAQASTDMYSWSAVCMLMITQIARTSGNGKAGLVVLAAKQIMGLDPDGTKTPCTMLLSAKDCPPTEVEMKDMERQKIGLVADAGVVVEYQVSYWKKKD
ncbi:hypothetical protein BDZ89DRAFT_1136073 [Hymenopellis radicata]|nr:hypothetical protein BDZ89DRAFT_1162251 [Hymenopellis radicata]KAF9024442.1 hypothetical protein BDZ89DRAFT_1136073 [Hymenopellis radicata]